MSKFTFVWWGDGYLVYDDGVYQGKDDQLNLVDLMVEAGVAVVKTVPAKWDMDSPILLEDFDGLRDGMCDDIEEVW
mgnify:CR=1 FL=1